MSALLQDLRFGLLMLAKNPGFTAVAVLTLALGIGANTAIFTVVNSVLLKPLPYPDSGRLVMLWESSPTRGFDQEKVSGPDFLDWRRQNDAFESIAFWPLARLRRIQSGRCRRCREGEGGLRFVGTFLCARGKAAARSHVSTRGRPMGGESRCADQLPTLAKPLRR